MENSKLTIGKNSTRFIMTPTGDGNSVIAIEFKMRNYLHQINIIKCIDKIATLIDHSDKASKEIIRAKSLLENYDLRALSNKYPEYDFSNIYQSANLG